MGFRLVDAPPLDKDFVVAHPTTEFRIRKWEQPWGEKRDVLCNFNELRIELQQQDAAPGRLVIVFRVFDDGVGFRYEWPEQPNLKYFEIADELTEFAFAAEAMAWWIPAYQREHYEYLYRHTPVSEISKAILRRRSRCRRHVTCQHPRSGAGRLCKHVAGPHRRDRRSKPI